MCSAAIIATVYKPKKEEPRVARLLLSRFNYLFMRALPPGITTRLAETRDVEN
jgi:hypothetical protein